MVHRTCGWTCAIAAPEAFMAAGDAFFVGYIIPVTRRRMLCWYPFVGIPAVVAVVCAGYVLHSARRERQKAGLDAQEVV